MTILLTPYETFGHRRNLDLQNRNFYHSYTLLTLKCGKLQDDNDRPSRLTQREKLNAHLWMNKLALHLRMTVVYRKLMIIELTKSKEIIHFDKKATL